MPVMPFEGLLPEDETATYGDPVDLTPEDEPLAVDVAWYCDWVLSGREAEFAEAHGDWWYGANTRQQAEYLNGSL